MPIKFTPGSLYTQVRIVPELRVLAVINNKWRERLVTVYEHPYDARMVVTIGVPFNPAREVIPCLEDRIHYERNIAEYAANGGQTLVSE